MSQSTIPLLDTVGQLELRVGNLDEARAFYGDVLGIHVESCFGQTMMLQCGDITILVQESSARPIGCPIYFRVDDRVHEVADQLKANGIRFKSGPSCIVEEFMGKSTWLAFFEDPWGNPLALMGDMPV
ncbi:VOC family protein [Pelagicoccus sp. SDUM812003]|uniref:VOC family protein n=1 Tax=Pelagicoccus sp. SDUM812003 TaxID=3041267 RepID=UPI00280CAC01|nr:VOC family protein [Pelagicoccus sp. SDUM812003]MDQ8203633.1 VOC family protein [Pelagicoccus sp. SDUM812003]